MKSIEIRTSQNVTINYQVAALYQRVLAFLLDTFFNQVISILLTLLIIFLLSLLDAGSSGDWYESFNYLLITPIWMGYTLISEASFKGQTFGKMALGIRVIRIDGNQVTFLDYVLRWSFRLLDLWMTCGALASIMSSGSPKGQRLGGMVSNTTVVKLNPKLPVALREVLSIDSRTSYTPVYPEVRHFKEGDMLLMKQTIDRYNRFKNPAHLDALNLLVEQVSTELQIPAPKEDKVGFIRTLIKDYIVLTR